MTASKSAVCCRYLLRWVVACIWEVYGQSCLIQGIRCGGLFTLVYNLSIPRLGAGLFLAINHGVLLPYVIVLLTALKRLLGILLLNWLYCRLKVWQLNLRLLLGVYDLVISCKRLD